MGGGSFSSKDYDDGVKSLIDTGKVFDRSVKAATSGDYEDIAKILDPKEMKNGLRESCFLPGVDDVMPIIVSIDGTGSMQKIPYHIQEELPKLLDTVIEEGLSEHPNLMFMCHDDETVVKNAAFQISQFEIEANKLVESLNELVIPGQGGGNDSEAYHLALYAAANHTRLESYEKNGEKGFMFLIGDEEPYFRNLDTAKYGTKPEVVKGVFGTSIQDEVPMLESLKKVLEKFHFFVIRPGDTSHGKEKRITGNWQKLIKAAGGNPQNVLEVEQTDAIIPTMVMSIGMTKGMDADELVDVLNTKGASGVKVATEATRAIVPVSTAKAVVGKASSLISTGGEKRRRR